MTSVLHGIKGLLIDLDGVVYEGKNVIPEAPRFFQRLRAAQMPFLLVTNNSSATPDEFADRLNAMGIPVAPSEVLTSAIATGAYLATESPQGGRAFIIGENGLAQAVKKAGFELAESNLDYVVAGLDRGFNYHKLTVAINGIFGGAKFVASNPDPTLPAENGVIPGAGSLQAAVTAATGVYPVVIGKPETALMLLGLKRLGLTKDEVAAIGDRLDTDILGGHRSGLRTILVLTGIAQREDVPTAEATPTFVAENLDAVAQELSII